MTDDIDASTVIAALRSSHERLRSLAEPLTEDQLNQPGYPSEWSIAQVLSHLGSGAEITTGTVDAGLAGVEPPGRDANPPIWDRWNNKTPLAQRDDALVTNAGLVERFEGMTAEQRAGTTFSWIIGPTNTFGVVRGRLAEHTVHTWDVAVMLDPHATLLPEAVPIVLTWLPRVVSFSAKPGQWRGRIHVTTAGPKQEYALTIGDQSTMEDWDGGSEDATLELPAEALVRLVYGRLDPAHTPDVRATGVSLDELRSVFRGF